MIRAVLVVVLVLWGLKSFAAEAKVPGQIGFFPPRPPLISVAHEGGSSTALGSGSLFIGANKGGLFAPLPPRAKPGRVPSSAAGGLTGKLLDLIARAEAGKAQYDAVQYGARVKPPRRPTQMTLGDILDWIDETPGQPHAIGRYQFIPPTLRSLMKRKGYDRAVRFTPGVQDALAYLLLQDAGLDYVRAGQMSRETFMLNLAKIWAGLPTANGQSYYHGVAGNAAVISWSDYDRSMRRIFSG